MSFVRALSNTWRVAPSLVEEQQGAADMMFQTARVAMCFYGQWFAPQFRDSIKDFRWGVTLPPGDKRDVYLSAGMNGWGMYAHTPHPDEAWRLMEFLLGPEGQSVTAEIGWNIPANRKVAESPVFRENPKLDRQVTATFLAAAPKAVLWQINPDISMGEVELYLNPELQRMSLGELTPEEALRRAATRINQALADNRAILGKEGSMRRQEKRR
jgi:multiple sugar transport system substrate-binding protein